MIRLVNVTKSFGANTVLRGLDLEVESGETVAVIGRSGTGKSVLLKHIARLLRPDAGEVWVGDVEVSTAPPEQVKKIRERMGYVFQFAALFDSMTLADNIRMALRYQKLDRRDIDRRTFGILEVVGLEAYADSMPAELSGGMRKRAGVARAVVSRPEFLLYDEPTTGLDPVTTAMIDDLALRLKAELRPTTVMVTHDMQSAFRVADRIAMLHEGRIHALGDPEAIRSSADPIVRAFVEGRMDLWPTAQASSETSEVN
jgi:phospholipid/cholesterol/gamma-HCH transport system ATP-binding protein